MFGYTDGKKAGPSWARAMVILLGILMASMAQPAPTGQHITKALIDGELLELMATPEDENTPFGSWELIFFLVREYPKTNPDAYYQASLRFLSISGGYQAWIPGTSMQCSVNKNDGNLLLLDIPMPQQWGDEHTVIATLNLQWQCDSRDRSRFCFSDHFTSDSGTTTLIHDSQQTYSCKGSVVTGQVVVKIDDVEYMGKVDHLRASTWKKANLEVWHV